MSPIYYINGRFVPQSAAMISVHDLGLVRGYGVFEYTRTYGRRPFELAAHLQRLAYSAEQLELPLPCALDQLEGLIQETIDQNPHLPEMGLRLIVTGGVSPSLLYPPEAPSLLILATPPAVFPEELYETGGKVITTTLARLLPDVKSLNYSTAVRALRRAKAMGAIEAIYVDPAGYLSEGTTSSLVAVRGHELLTAPDGLVLNGITRNVVLRLAAEMGYSVTQRLIHREELPHLDELFLTSSAKEVLGICQIDEQLLAAPGPVTRALAEQFRAYTNLTSDT